MVQRVSPSRYPMGEGLTGQFGAWPVERPRWLRDMRRVEVWVQRVSIPLRLRQQRGQ